MKSSGKSEICNTSQKTYSDGNTDRKMEGMREIATAYYERASEEEKESAEEFFRKLDVNSDGKVSLLELKRSVGSWLSNETVFKQLDENGDGTLDFYEVFAVYYMVNKVNLLVCSGCWGLLVGPYFSCLLCLGKSPDTFDLCCNCYRRGTVAHEHSDKYLLDHHSLLAVLRNRSKEAEKSQGKKEMEEFREIARAHYRAGSPEVQALAYEFFKSMDTNGDGKVDLSEFLTFMRLEGYSQMRSPHFFNELDHDGNGALDFSEVMTLYYIIKSGRPFCDGCGNFIPGIFFSCVECFKNPQRSFNLCRDCYRSTKCNHNHDGRVQFLDNYTLLEAKRDEALVQTAGINLNEPWTTSSNAIVPRPQSDMYINTTYPTYNTYIVHPPTPSHNYSTAIVPAASTTDKWRLALQAFEVALSIGSISTTMCTIL